MTDMPLKFIDGNVDSALLLLRHRTSQHGVIRDMKRHEEALRSGERRRNKQSKVLKAQRKAQVNA
jgi:ribosomal protein S21